MAQKEYYMGTFGAFIYDDADASAAFRTDHVINASGVPTDPDDLARLQDLPTVPTAASTVETEKTLGQTEDVGVSSNYAREDHTHGTPPGGWEDLRVTMNAVKLAGVKDPGFEKFLDNGAGSAGVFLYWFDKTTEEEVFFTVQLPHSWKEGSDIYPHVHWVPKTAKAANPDVCWGLEYTWANKEAVFGKTTIVYSNTRVPTGTTTDAAKHYKTTFAAISGTGKTFSSMLICRLFRDAAGVGLTDDYDDDVGLLEFDLHIELDTIGSSSQSAK